jgi:hypothetical protein
MLTNNLPVDKPKDDADKAKDADDLPEFLKQRLKARGILKDKAANPDNNNTDKQNVTYTLYSWCSILHLFTTLSF